VPVEGSDASRDPHLDALRGLAITMVMFFHAAHFEFARTSAETVLLFLPAMAWTSVDLFFALSGFLITGILLRTRRSSSYFRSFYSRRALRIIPLYYAVLLFFLVILPLLHVRDLWVPGVPHGTWWYWLFASNLHAARFGEFSHSVLSVTWTLAVEEHFYLLWPLLVRRFGDAALLRICVGVMLGGLALRVLCVALGAPLVAAYVLTPCRLEPLAAGSALAILATRPGGLERFDRAARIGLPACIALFLALCWALGPRHVPSNVALGVAERLMTGSMTFTRDPWMVTLGLTLLAVFWGALLVRSQTASERSPVGRLLDLGFLRTMGLYSYALYLLHVFVDVRLFPIFQEAANQPGRYLYVAPTYWAFYFGVSYALARVSWRVLEGPLLELKRYVPYRV